MTLFLNNRGQGLIQVMIASAIAGVIMVAIASMQNNQARENRAMNEKLAANDFQNQMLRSFLNGAVCSALLNGKQFNSTGATSSSPNKPTVAITDSEIRVSTLAGAPVLAKAGEPVSPIARTLKVARANSFNVVDLVGTSDGTNGTYSGTFQINFEQGDLIRPVKSASSTVILRTDSTPPTETIKSCTSVIDNTCWIANANGLTATSCGNVGIGTATPQSALTVNGAANNASSISNPTRTIDFSRSNLQFTSLDCAAFTLLNVKDGGSYSLALQTPSAGTTACSFAAFRDNGATPVSVKLPPFHGPPTAGSQTIYTFLAMGGVVYVAWGSGYP